VLVDAPEVALGNAAHQGLVAPDLAEAAAAWSKAALGRELAFACGSGGDCWQGAGWLYQASLLPLEPPRLPVGVRAEPGPVERWGVANLAAHRLLPAPPR
jgi:hypothetical protein